MAESSKDGLSGELSSKKRLTDELLKLAQSGRAGKSGPEPLDLIDQNDSRLLDILPDSLLSSESDFNEKAQVLKVLLEYVSYESPGKYVEQQAAFGDLLGLTQLTADIRRHFDKYMGRGKPNEFVRYNRHVRLIISTRHFNRGAEWVKTKEGEWAGLFVDRLLTALADPDELAIIAEKLGLRTSASHVGQLPGSRRQSLVEAARQAWSTLADPPFDLISPVPDRSWDWQSVLDGSDLTPMHAKNGAIVSRRVVANGTEMDEHQFAAWLTRRVGKNLLLRGGPGDGKSSYINKLAVDSSASHVFLSWNDNISFNHRIVESYRQTLIALLRANTSETVPTIVVNYTLSPYSDQLMKLKLIPGLNSRARVGDDVVVIISSRQGQLNRLWPHVKAEWVDLASVNSDEAYAWVELLRRARSALGSEGLAEEQVNVKYPNLEAFLEMDASSQVQLLTDESTPVLVRLLKAVYGEDMRRKLVQELEGLDDPADWKAYFHICLATAFGATLPQFMLEAMTPGANLRARSDHDPWITRGGEHAARHQIIAQVVLEESRTLRSIHDSLDEAVRGYTDRLREARNPRYLGTLQKIISAARSLDIVGTPQALNVFRSSLIEVLRDALLDIERLADLVDSQSGQDYRTLVQWAETVKVLIETANEPAGRSARIVGLMGIADSLWLKAERVARGDASKGWIRYERTMLRIRKEEIECAGDLNLQLLSEDMESLRDLFGARWWKAGFYRDVFYRSLNGLEMLASERIGEELLDQAITLYETFFKSYEYLRALPGSGDITSLKKVWYKMLNQMVNLHLPRHYAARVVKESWLTSLSLGKPNVQTAKQYAKEVLDWSADEPQMVSGDLLVGTVEMLQIASDTEPGSSEALLLLAMLGEQGRAVALPSVAERLEALAEAVPTGIDRAFVSHGLALLGPGKEAEVGYLKDAVSGYLEYVENGLGNRRQNGFRFLRIKSFWNRACVRLRKSGCPDWQDYQNQFDQISQNYHDG